MDNLLKKDTKLVKKEGIFSPENLPPGDYDNKAKFYDLVISHPLYNHIVWGNSPNNYTQFAREACQKSNPNQPILDAGCGTLSFTHAAYRDFHNENFILCDLSTEMLKIARKRLCVDGAGFSFLRADILDLPFKDKTFETILSFGTLHVVPAPSVMLKELRRVLQPGGKLYLTALCNDRPLSRFFLKLLQKRNLVHTVATGSEIEQIVRSSGFQTEAKVIGGMVYISAVK